MRSQRHPTRITRPLLSLLAVAAVVLAGCVAAPASSPVDSDSQSIARRIAALMPVDALLLGEQHDAPEHHAIERAAVQALAERGQLAALALEMAEEGNGTAHLPASATEAQVRTALSWDEGGWPWSDYGPAVMAAVQAGVPVLGANLPRTRMKDAMADVSLDAQLAAPAYRAQQEAVREGHCGLLPERQIVPMTRIQLARDRAMAQAIVKARQPGKAVVLITGAGHALRPLGIPQHLPDDVRVATVQLLAAASASDVAPGAYDAVWQTAPLPAKDYCAELRPASRSR